MTTPRPGTRPARPVPTDPPGAPARRIAVAAIAGVIDEQRALDETLDRLLAAPSAREMDERDRGLARAIAMSAVRHFGLIRRVLLERMETGMPERAGAFAPIMVAGAAQILFLDVPDHAAVDLSVRLIQADGRASRYSKFANAILRRVVREQEAIRAGLDPLQHDTPGWLRERWTRHYGEDAARRIAAAHQAEPAVDLTVRSDAEGWAGQLDALVLPTGSLRLRQRGAIASLPGFDDGAWWVQDAAAALPARLLAPRPGERIADLCAAPGGKTAQLAAAGASVLAVDRSRPRLERLERNMARLGLTVEARVDDALSVEETGFDAVLVDAPCSATGTLRRHPDVAWTKSEDDIARLAGLQRRLLRKAVDMLKPGGRLVYCTCSLEPEEGEEQIAALLAAEPRVRREPVRAGEIGGLAEAIDARGDLRTLPFMLPNEEPRLAGMDGFFAARLIREG
ncbi:methyltransferase domain-containing protein [Alsobacter sp. SYSU M60028]|uniref:Methyltransferase domain-containing protein n=1 Tax=Alsobacter ponti TaxID=2962936 RepID=A0ABT1LGA7_9HYPH|nr:RsmB/NOP family class I SAM-dependent RNA methyltransferase [Alsobacter ponti]MCP8940527.1 methyltransferase domain-containing protein [Alsobacter ponti]